MVDQETNEFQTTERIKQTISIPFLWEEKPGTPKTGWKRVNDPIMQMPIKLIASVPFMWEEKPGTPLAGPFSHPSSSREAKMIMPCTPPQPVNRSNPFEGSGSDSDSDSGHDHFNQEINLGSETELGFIHSSSNYQNASHKNNPFCDTSDDEFEHGDDNNDDDYLHAPSSPAWETESVASSYATEITTASTLAGSSFLESMFPLMTKKASGVTETKADHGSRGITNNTCTQIVSYDADERKPFTLGEMIMMSRRRSFLKRAVRSLQHDDHSTDLMMMNGFGCCGIDIGGLQKLKRQLQLKLI
uniref:uncharacterized protein LOC122588250 n=1 Tax=Erigeron canadensis TaxID=72917 RepID=UPI001CB8B367|nr:uncharacterized protein LOC122588250 [Erigeron canadensis]